MNCLNQSCNSKFKLNLEEEEKLRIKMNCLYQPCNSKFKLEFRTMVCINMIIKMQIVKRDIQPHTPEIMTILAQCVTVNGGNRESQLMLKMEFRKEESKDVIKDWIGLDLIWKSRSWGSGVFIHSCSNLPIFLNYILNDLTLRLVFKENLLINKM